jgi:hypothetical protein
MNSRPFFLSVLARAAAVLMLFLGWQARVALAQTGNLDARLPQAIGSPQPDSNTPSGRGEVFDPDALKHTKSFCLDLNHIDDSEAAGVKEFLAKENQPKKLLGRLPWQLVDDCTKADAVARIYFARADVSEDMSGPGVVSTAVRIRHGLQSVLLLYDKASIRLFYRAQGQVLARNEEDALRVPFSTLVKDLKKIDR